MNSVKFGLQVTHRPNNWKDANPFLPNLPIARCPSASISFLCYLPRCRRKVWKEGIGKTRNEFDAAHCEQLGAPFE